MMEKFLLWVVIFLDGIEQRISSIKQKLSDAERRKARAEVQRDQAKESFKNAVGRLQSIFQVSSIEEAKSLLDDIQTQLDEVLCEVEGTLSMLE